MSSELLQTSESIDQQSPKVIIKKTYNGLEVVDSGVIHSFDSQEITISVNSVIINFKFLNDDNLTEGKFEIKADPSHQNVMNINLYNMDSPFYEGAPHPIHVANVGNSRVLISFFVSTIDKKKGARAFQYSVLVGV